MMTLMINDENLLQLQFQQLSTHLYQQQQQQQQQHQGQQAMMMSTTKSGHDLNSNYRQQNVGPVVRDNKMFLPSDKTASASSLYAIGLHSGSHISHSRLTNSTCLDNSASNNNKNLTNTNCNATSNNNNNNNGSSRLLRRSSIQPATASGSANNKTTDLFVNGNKNQRQYSFSTSTSSSLICSSSQQQQQHEQQQLQMQPMQLRSAKSASSSSSMSGSTTTFGCQNSHPKVPKVAHPPISTTNNNSMMSNSSSSSGSKMSTTTNKKEPKRASTTTTTNNQISNKKNPPKCERPASLTAKCMPLSLPLTLSTISSSSSCTASSSSSSSSPSPKSSSSSSSSSSSGVGSSVDSMSVSSRSPAPSPSPSLTSYSFDATANTSKQPTLATAEPSVFGFDVASQFVQINNNNNNLLNPNVVPATQLQQQQQVDYNDYDYNALALHDPDSVTYHIAQQIEFALRQAKQANCLNCCQVSIPCNLTYAIAQDILQMSETEPCGLRGCTLFINLEEKDSCQRIASFKFGDCYTVATFEMFLTLKRVPTTWLNNVSNRILKNFGRNSIVISDLYKLSKKKLYRTPSYSSY